MFGRRTVAHCCKPMAASSQAPRPGAYAGKEKYGNLCAVKPGAKVRPQDGRDSGLAPRGGKTSDHRSPKRSSMRVRPGDLRPGMDPERAQGSRWGFLCIPVRCPRCAARWVAARGRRDRNNASSALAAPAARSCCAKPHAARSGPVSKVRIFVLHRTTVAAELRAEWLRSEARTANRVSHPPAHSRQKVWKFVPCPGSVAPCWTRGVLVSYLHQHAPGDGACRHGDLAGELPTRHISRHGGEICAWPRHARNCRAGERHQVALRTSGERNQNTASPGRAQKSLLSCRTGSRCDLEPETCR